MSYGTGSTGSSLTWSGISVAAGSSPEPANAPKSLIATRAVEMKDGWTGQVIIGGEVLLEDSGWENSDDAEQWATTQVLDVIKGLFVKPATQNARKNRGRNVA